MALGLAIVSLLVGLASPAHAQTAPISMKLSTATLNDTQHEWLKRFAAAVEQDSGGRIKGEIYPASQLGSIPRQIEGVQFGSIQGWVGPPEFLVGVDERYEVLSSPGLFTNADQYQRTIDDPTVRDMVLGLGANKGLTGAGIFPIGPSSIITRKQIRQFADYAGLKIRVLASPFQLEMIKRMGASPVAMTLADVLPALQQGAIDGSLTTITQYTTLHYIDAAKYVVETNQPYVTSIAVLSKKWVEGLPADLQKIVIDDARKDATDIVPFVHDFFTAQGRVWVQQGGDLTVLAAADQEAMLAKISSIAADLSASKPELNAAVKVVFAAAAKNK
jgi:TRAP-type C4-dicarboxylate transport system substrate-binding protein